LANETSQLGIDFAIQLCNMNVVIMVTFRFFVAGNRRHFKFGMLVEHSKSQSTNDKPSLKFGDVM